MDLSYFAVDEKLEEEGCRIEYPGGAYLLVARAGNERYKKRFRKLTAPIARQMELGTVAEEQAAELLLKCEAETILIGWGGWEKDGAEYPYTVEHSYDLLKTMPKLREDVNKVSGDFANYRKRQEEADAEVLGKESSGNSNGGRTSKVSKG